MEAGEQPQEQFAFEVPPELETGTYANILGVWHSPHEFTLDFSVSGQAIQPPEPGEPVMIPCKVVARVKVAPSLVFDLLQALNANMTRYEQNFGEIKRPEPGESE